MTGAVVVGPVEPVSVVRVGGTLVVETEGGNSVVKGGLTSVVEVGGSGTVVVSSGPVETEDVISVDDAGGLTSVELED